MSRKLICVDLETTSLDTNTCAVLEVCAIDTVTGEEIYFAPHVTREQLADADPHALRVNRYYERGVWMDMGISVGDHRWDDIEKMLLGNTLGGSNPTFDAAILARFMMRCWHHRLADLAAYAAPAMGLGPHELPGLDAVCEHFAVTNPEPHSARGDAHATVGCFRMTSEWYADMRSQMALSGSQRGRPK